MFELTGGDAPTLVAWAARHADGDPHTTIFAVLDGPEGLGLVHLAGEDPTGTD